MKFLRVDKIRSDGTIEEHFINMQHIAAFNKIPATTRICMYKNPATNEEDEFDLHKNGYKTMISLSDNLNVLEFCCKLSFDELLQTMGAQIINS